MYCVFFTIKKNYGFIPHWKVRFCHLKLARLRPSPILKPEQQPNLQFSLITARSDVIWYEVGEDVTMPEQFGYWGFLVCVKFLQSVIQFDFSTRLVSTDLLKAAVIGALIHNSLCNFHKPQKVLTQENLHIYKTEVHICIILVFINNLQWIAGAWSPPCAVPQSFINGQCLSPRGYADGCRPTGCLTNQRAENSSYGVTARWCWAMCWQSTVKGPVCSMHYGFVWSKFPQISKVQKSKDRVHIPGFRKCIPQCYGIQ